jgi:hypothetical protein
VNFFVFWVVVIEVILVCNNICMGVNGKHRDNSMKLANSIPVGLQPNMIFRTFRFDSVVAGAAY